MTTKTCPSEAREAALVAILRAANISNENGDQFLDFGERRRDCLDFGSVHILTLQSLMDAAYMAGAAAALASAQA